MIETEYLHGMRARVVVELCEALRIAGPLPATADLSVVDRAMLATEWIARAESEVSEIAPMMRREELTRCTTLVGLVRECCRRRLHHQLADQVRDLLR